MTPTKNKIILTVILSMVFFSFSFMMLQCTLFLRTCDADANTPDAREFPEGVYKVNAKHVPFSCEQTCTDSEYNSAVLNALIFTFLAPFAVIYLLSSLLLFWFNKFRFNKPA